MIMTPEQAALKARNQFDHLLDLVRQAAQDGPRIDPVERGLMRHLLALGHALLTSFIAPQGDGDRGPEAQTPDDRTGRRRPGHHDRQDISILGALTITRVGDGTREGQKNHPRPGHSTRGLPERGTGRGLHDAPPQGP
jgi:hypothetical protein